jgi:2-iminoacetate synthase ThiH
MIRQAQIVEPNQRNASSLWLTELVEYVKANQNCGGSDEVGLIALIK